MNKKVEAKQTLETALAQAKLLGWRLHEALILIGLGKLAAGEDNADQAIQYLESAATMSSTKGLHHTTAWNMFELAKLYKQRGELSKAEERATLAFRAMLQVGDRYHLPQHLALLAELKASRGEPLDAHALYEQATDVTEGMLVNVPSAQSKSSLIALMSEIYLGHFNLCVNQLKDTGKAFQVLERARGRTIADNLRSEPVEPSRSGATSSDAEKEIRDLQLALMKAATRNERQGLLSRLWLAGLRLDPTAEDLDRLRELTSRGEPVTLNKAQESLKPNELMLEYVLQEPTSYCLAISRDKVSLGLCLERSRSKV
jgi:tetratricopeptide (TPR) repeat protein